MVRLFKILIGRRKLPERMVEHTIERMAVNEVAYTMPWAMWVDLDRTGWLHPQYPAHPYSGGTADMMIVRTKDGFHVSTPYGQKYTPSAEPGYCGSDNNCQFLQVASIC